MKAEFVMRYLPRMMQQRGHGDNYTVEYKDIVAPKAVTVKIDAANSYYFLVEGFFSDVVITSDNGVYDLLNDRQNEQQHEHTGAITILNNASEVCHLEFIVVTIKNKKDENN